MLASVVTGKAALILQDTGYVHWTAATMLGWFNSAQRLIVMVRPDAKTTRGLVTLVAGAHQTLPVGALRLIKIVRNETGRAVTLISEEQLTNFDRNWYQATAKTPTKHYLFDPLEPVAFDCFPPAVLNTKLLAVWSVLPTDCATTAEAISLDDIYEVPLIHLTVYLAYLQDAENASNLALAEKHMEFAMLALTGKTAADGKIAPANSQPAKVRPNVR